jgi:cytochrome c
MKGLAVVLSSLASLGTILAMGQVHPYGDPRAETSRGRETLLQGTSMPANVRAVLVNKCADCHSAETRWPVYASVAPGSWLIERDIMRGRQQMDLSQWARLSEGQQETLRGEILHEARAGKMPPIQYRLIHWEAKLTATELEELSALKPGTDDVPAAGDGDAARGKAVFEKRCVGCHALETDREGPRLAGVFGKKAGSVPGFEYSTSLKSSGLTWDDATLEKWLTDPDIMVPGNDMSVGVPKAQERKDLVAFLKSMKKN